MAIRIGSLTIFLFFAFNLFCNNASKAQDSDFPLSSPLECSRTCREGEPPKICYYKFVLELYSVLGYACDLCTPNATDIFESTCQCILADGVEKGMLSVNRMLPGPSIQVCAGDEVVVDLQNKMNGMEATIHWHGVWQVGTPFFDGVPYVNQCPISATNIFRYQWTAATNNTGTHFWHSHDGLLKLDGIAGSLVIRRPKSQEPNGHLYDHDLTSHVIFLSDWLHKYSSEVLPGHHLHDLGQNPDNFLINGKGQFTDPATGITTNTSLAVFEVTRGQRYRFRMINGFCTSCIAAFTIEGHSITTIASDGWPIEPVEVDTIYSMTGERYDFVLDANQPVGSYWIQIRGLNGCKLDEVQQLGILRYVDAVSENPKTPRPTYNKTLSQGVVLGPLDGSCDKPRPDAICINQVKIATPTDKELLKEKPDVKLYIPFAFKPYTPETLFIPNVYDHFFAAVNKDIVAGLMDGISNVFPPSPIISQFDDIPPGHFCNSSHTVGNCVLPDNCTCTHVVNLPLGAIVEVIIIDSIDTEVPLQHPFHLHGFVFAVLDLRVPPGPQIPLTVEYVKKMDKEGKIHRNLESPTMKDTLSIPQHGLGVIRFRANNPGPWFFHCHILFHNDVGMAMVFNVGEENQRPPIPPNFPKCGNFKPAIKPPREMNNK